MTNTVGIRRRRKGRRNKAKQVGEVGQYAEDAWSLAKRTMRGLNEIRKLVNIETKLLVAYTSTSVDFNGSIVGLSRIAQGSNYTERVGDSIKLQHMICRYRIFLNASDTQSIVRVIVFKDLFQQGTPPTVTDVLETGPGGVSTPLSSINFLKKDRFPIIHDELYSLDTAGGTTAVGMIDKPLQSHVKYIGTTAAAASDAQGSVYVLLVSDENTNLPTVNFYSNLYFTDD